MFRCQGYYRCESRGTDEVSVEYVPKAMKVPNPTAGECLEAAVKLKDKGYSAFKFDEYALSLHYNIETYRAMHFIVEAKRFAINFDCFFNAMPLRQGCFQGQHVDLIQHH